MSNKLTYQIPDKSEPCNEHLVANITEKQKAFIQEMSKKFENESEFVRFMIDGFMENNINFKEVENPKSNALIPETKDEPWYERLWY